MSRNAGPQAATVKTAANTAVKTAAKKAAVKTAATSAVKSAVKAVPKKAATKSAGKTAAPVKKVAAKKVAAKKAPNKAAPDKAVTESALEILRPDYWAEACADLMKRDRILRKIIPLYGPAQLASRGAPFVTLARSIVGQQISVKAAQSVWDRLITACPSFAPASVLQCLPADLAACGLSKRKTEYIFDLAGHFQSGAVHADQWAEMDDEAVIEELTQIRGIGRWTAEMFLMFNLLRPNVLPLDDLGLIKAISLNYFSGEPVTRSEAREVSANWAPWRTVATWYMWRSLDPIPVEY